MSELPDLSKAEYKILNIMWKGDEYSIREVHNALSNDWALSTTKTTIERMSKKGLLERRNLHGVNVYKPAISRPAGLARWVSFFADHVLGLDAKAVVSMFGESDHISDKELKELDKLVKQLQDK